jgi:hypothetical protein
MVVEDEAAAAAWVRTRLMAVRARAAASRGKEQLIIFW